MRMSVLCAILLTICCVGLTVVLNVTAFHMVDTIEATPIQYPATSIVPEVVAPIALEMQDAQSAKQYFSIQSLLYMLVVIVGGSVLTYIVSGNVLKPLDTLNHQVKHMDISTLSQPLDVPSTKDEIAELTRSFNEMIASLNNAFVMQKQFSLSAAHELRTPLAILQTQVDVFNKKSQHTISEYDALKSVFEKQILRLRSLVKNLLDMTNLDDEREQTHICVLDMLEEIVTDLSFKAQEKQVSMTLVSDDSMMYGNIELLYQAFYNLVENGIKYNREGGSVHIGVNTTSNQQTIIRIEDSGIGIKDAYKSHIFEPFYRVDKSLSRDMGGAGLGLSIVEHIIKKHGGRIFVLDREGGGTIFQIVI